MEKISIRLREKKENENDFIDMAFDEIDKLDKEISKYAKARGFDASFFYDDDATYLTIYATDKSAQCEQYELPKEAVELINNICKGCDSSLVIQSGDSCIEDKKNTMALWFHSSPMCANSKESYSNICDYCDYIKSLLK